ncbi:MAG: glutamine-hydrolyzing carbamoyl-phosphate synthase small subunit [Candidatus Sabulitectum sp.]|nr:glutamine-hydrolyzing carbamoyl-phosphate synthase small subunit [Candidatus Sabulitectum sp.]
MELNIGSGLIFTGKSFGAERSVTGEVVFYTGMVGYTEALTDPSYTGQILVLTFPLVGNYGVPGRVRDRFALPVEFESERICVAGLVVSSFCDTPSHFNKMESLRDWLVKNNIPAICDVDTRAITKHLRESGTVPGSIKTGTIPLVHSTATAAEQCKSTLQEVTSYSCGEAEAPLVALIDCGVKTSIIRNLLLRKMDVLRIPFNNSLSGVDCSGILISNGPGDPEQWTETIDTIRDAMDLGVPVLGICLGHQIIALAAGGSTEKMKYGHRSQNQPCLEENVDFPQFLLTSQNHGYQVTRNSLPHDWDICFTNVNDGSVEGIRHREKPIIGVQFHPEASPGPLDAGGIFSEFAKDVFRKWEGGSS